MPAGATDAPGPEPRLGSRLTDCLPFLGTTFALLVAGFLCLLYDASLGPPAFPLWTILLVIGLASAVGTSVAWFLASRRVTPAIRARTNLDPNRPASPARSRAARPAPTEPWFEGPPAAPAVSATPADDFGTILAEIDMLERDSARHSVPEASSAR